MASAVNVALIAMCKFHYIDCSMASPEDCKTLQGSIHAAVLKYEVRQFLAAGARRFEVGERSGLDLEATPSLPLAR